MRRLALLAALLPVPALAQHQDHGAHTQNQGQAQPDPHAGHEAADPHAGHVAAEPDPHAGHDPADPHAGHAPAEPEPHAGHAPAEPDPHAGHAPAEPDPHAGHAPAEPDPHAGHAPAEPDPHAGHAPAEPDPHAGHDMHAGHASAEAPPVAPPPPAAFAGPAHAADLVYGDAAMARAREELRREHGDMTAFKFLLERLEARIGEGEDGYLWDAQAWWGGDIDKVWLKTEGEGEFGGALEVEVQALWSHAIDPWFDVQAGVRQDFGPGPERTYFVLGVQGLAPYWFEVDGALFLSHEGDLTARFEGEYDLRITQSLILQPRIEIDLSAQDVPELGIGAGLSEAAAGLRLRYEIEPEFAPYVGIEYQRAFGATADFARAAGEETGGWSLLLGIRAWY